MVTEIETIPTRSRGPMGWRQTLVLITLFVITAVFGVLILHFASNHFREVISIATSSPMTKDGQFESQLSAQWQRARSPIFLSLGGFFLFFLAFCFYCALDLWRMATYVGYPVYLKVPVVSIPLLYFLLLAPPIVYVAVLAITAPGIPLNDIPILDYPMEFAENHMMKLFWANLLCWTVVLVPYDIRARSKAIIKEG